MFKNWINYPSAAEFLFLIVLQHFFAEITQGLLQIQGSFFSSVDIWRQSIDCHKYTASSFSNKKQVSHPREESSLMETERDLLQPLNAREEFKCAV